MNKVEFLAILKRERLKFEDMLVKCGFDRMDIHGVSGIYLIKDVVAHLNAYNLALVSWLREAKAGRVYVDNVLYQSGLDARNAVIYERNRNREPQEVVKTFQQTWDELESSVRMLTDDELTNVEMTAWFVEPRWQIKQALWKCIANDSYEHQQQHTPDIERWLMEQGSVE